jgi:hypothetical protein
MDDKNAFNPKKEPDMLNLATVQPKNQGNIIEYKMLLLLKSLNSHRALSQRLGLPINTIRNLIAGRSHAWSTHMLIAIRREVNSLRNLPEIPDLSLLFPDPAACSLRYIAMSKHNGWRGFHNCPSLGIPGTGPGAWSANGGSDEGAALDAVFILPSQAGGFKESLYIVHQGWWVREKDLPALNAAEDAAKAAERLRALELAPEPETVKRPGLIFRTPPQDKE